MWVVLYKIWQSFCIWFSNLSKQLIMIVCCAGTVIGCMGFAIFMLMRIDNSLSNSDVEIQLHQIRMESTLRDSINFVYWTRQYGIITDSISEIKTMVMGHSQDISNITLILISNSNSDLIRRLQPYMDGIATKEDIYRFILEMEKQESAKRQFGIQVHKVEKPKDE